MNRERLAALIVVVPIFLEVAAIGWYGRAGVRSSNDSDAVVFELTGVAAQGIWTLDEVNGLNYWWKNFTPATLFLREGDWVDITLRSADLFHRFYVPALSVGPVDVKPGHTVSVRFQALRPGIFQYYCTSMCGTCHFYMRGWIVVTAEGEEPVIPPSIQCPLCLPDPGPPPRGDDLVELGAYMYLQKGCITCHGPDGRGGVENVNSAYKTIPAHNTTAQKLFLQSPEDAQAFVDLIHQTSDLSELDEPPEISRFPLVKTRFENAEEIIRKGRYSAKLQATGPEPPLQMPAWQYLIEEREIDALLSYFVSLQPWQEG